MLPPFGSSSRIIPAGWVVPGLRPVAVPADTTAEPNAKQVNLVVYNLILTITSNQVRLPAEFKHINTRRKRN